mmetsp:Transcript_4135/g.15435  ORF Transcript_4135/g.15435 Transcript_4135/m.15435 type:complete len:232 (-) Transcript_4135:1112-1807(-)
MQSPHAKHSLATFCSESTQRRSSTRQSWSREILGTDKASSKSFICSGELLSTMCMMTCVRPCSRVRTCWHQFQMLPSIESCLRKVLLAVSSSLSVVWCACLDQLPKVSRTSSTQACSTSVALSSSSAPAFSARPWRSSSCSASKRESRVSRAPAKVARSAICFAMRSSPATSSDNRFETSPIFSSHACSASFWARLSNLPPVSSLRSARARVRPSSTPEICERTWFGKALI